MRLVLFTGKTLLFLASMALITGISLFVVGAYLSTWPLMRVSPGNRKTKALMDVGVSVFGLVRTLGGEAEGTPESRA